MKKDCKGFYQHHTLMFFRFVKDINTDFILCVQQQGYLDNWNISCEKFGMCALCLAGVLCAHPLSLSSCH